MKAALTFLVLMTITAHTLKAAGEKGNGNRGGYGVKIGEKLYSLDLAMGGVAEKPYDSTDYTQTYPVDLEKILRRNLTPIANEGALNILIHKLAHFRGRLADNEVNFPIDLMVRYINQYIWIYHPDLPCLNVEDDETPYPHKFQVAYREGNYVRFCADFTQLDDANKAAVMLHEIVYASLTEKSELQGLVGFLFSDNFKNFDDLSLEHFQKLTGILLPFVTFLHDPNGNADHLGRYNLYIVKRLGTIDPSIVVDNPYLRNHTLCFGEDTQQNLRLWTVGKGDTCYTGLKYQRLFTYRNPFPRPYDNKIFEALTAGKDGIAYGIFDPSDTGKIERHLTKQDADAMAVGWAWADKLQLMRLCSGQDKGSLAFRGWCEVRAVDDEFGDPSLAVQLSKPVERYVRQIGNIAPEVLRALNIPEGYRACLGVFDSEFSLWIQKSDYNGGVCPVGDGIPVSHSVDLSRGGTGTVSEGYPVYYSRPPIGHYDINTDTLTALCTGEYESTCQVDLVRSTVYYK